MIFAFTDPATGLQLRLKTGGPCGLLFIEPADPAGADDAAVSTAVRRWTGAARAFQVTFEEATERIEAMLEASPAAPTKRAKPEPAPEPEPPSPAEPEPTLEPAATPPTIPTEEVGTGRAVLDLI